jgi:hypothetical protein
MTLRNILGFLTTRYQGGKTTQNTGFILKKINFLYRIKPGDAFTARNFYRIWLNILLNTKPGVFMLKTKKERPVCGRSLKKKRRG